MKTQKQSQSSPPRPPHIQMKLNDSLDLRSKDGSGLDHNEQKEPQLLFDLIEIDKNKSQTKC